MCVLMVFSERPRYTAARECYEETLGILGETDHLASLLDNCVENNVFEVCTFKLKFWDQDHYVMDDKINVPVCR